MAKLDRTRSYGVVVGDPKLAFEQDGVHYGPDMKEIERWTTPENLAHEVELRRLQQVKEQRLAMRRAMMEKNRIIKEED